MQGISDSNKKNKHLVSAAKATVIARQKATMSTLKKDSVQFRVQQVCYNGEGVNSGNGADFGSKLVRTKTAAVPVAMAIAVDIPVVAPAGSPRHRACGGKGKRGQEPVREEMQKKGKYESTLSGLKDVSTAVEGNKLTRTDTKYVEDVEDDGLPQVPEYVWEGLGGTM